MQIKHKSTDQKPLTLSPDHYHSTFDAISKIVADEGIVGLYSGIYGSLLGVASTNFAYFYWYSVIRTLYMSTQALPKPPSTAIELALGAAAGAVAQVFTIPVAVITTRQQTQPKGERKGLIETGKEVVESEDGWTGLWRGLKASLVLVVNPAITYGAYQRLRTFFFPGKTALRPHEAFCTFFQFGWLGANANHENSPWSHVQSARHDYDATTHRRQGWTPVATSASPTREEVQEFPRGHGIHH